MHPWLGSLTDALRFFPDLFATGTSPEREHGHGKQAATVTGRTASRAGTTVRRLAPYLEMGR
jgi:hypothetical protein